MSKQPPRNVSAIEQCGYAIWAGSDLPADFRSRFDSSRIPVVGVRNVRIWGIQVDDERALPGLERTSIPDEELWELVLRAKDGSTYEVNSRFLKPATV